MTRLVLAVALLVGCTSTTGTITSPTPRPTSPPTTQPPLTGVAALGAATPDPSMDVRIVITASQYGNLQARVTVVGFAESTCAASAILPSRNESTAQGLQTRHTVATGERTLTWTYAKAGNTQAGRGEHTVSCTRGFRPPSVAVEPFTVP